MSLVADQQIAEFYEKIRDDRDETTWMVLQYVDEKTDKLTVAASGAGGLEEFKAALKEDQAAYGYLRVAVGNDELSTRAKFVLVSWCGSQVKVMRRAKLSVHISDVKAVIKNYAVEVAASTINDLSEKEVMTLVKKAMGANYDRQASDY